MRRMEPQPQGVKPTTGQMRWLLSTASVLVLVAGVQLFILTEYTDRFFAWTITPPITAAFLGVAYWSSFVLEVLAARRRVWARARIAVPTALTFTTLTLVATLLHLDRFHLGGPTLEAQVAAWAWLVVYVGVPPVFGWLLFKQLRVPGGDPPRRMALPLPLRQVLALQGGVLAFFGLLFFIIPQVVEPIWPWSVVPLTGRAIGAWLLAMAVAAFHSLRENDLDRIYPGMISYTVFGALQVVALFRYTVWVRWSEISAWLYLLFCLSVLVTGLVAIYWVRRIPTQGD